MQQPYRYARTDAERVVSEMTDVVFGGSRSKFRRAVILVAVSILSGKLLDRIGWKRPVEYRA